MREYHNIHHYQKLFSPSQHLFVPGSEPFFSCADLRAAKRIGNKGVKSDTKQKIETMKRNKK